MSYNHRGNRGLNQSDIRQNKSLGQVFLNTDWPVKRIVEQAVAMGIERVIEIGPGNGILTLALADAGIHVTAIEKDTRFAERLITITDSDIRQKIDVVNQDVLKFDLNAWIHKSKQKNQNIKLGVLGNIPYNISTPIVMWALPSLKDLVATVLMVQLEFAQRIVSAPDSKAYGSLSVFCQLRAICDFNFEVGKNCFTPVPKVDSAVITLRHRPKPAATEQQLNLTETICRVAFTLRRKKLRNGVKPFMGSLDEKDCPIDLNRRAETLSPQDFVELAGFLFANKLKS